jgi:L-cysteine desulfidase
MTDTKNILKILKDQVKPALGCTEPGAVAYAVARAKEILNEEVKELKITTDKNILKNGLVVGIPGTEERGIIFAAALSLVVGKSEYALEALKEVTQEDIDAALKIVETNNIQLDYDREKKELYICVEATGQNSNSCVIIENSHTNIVFERKDQQILLDKCQAYNGDQPSQVNQHQEREIKYDIKNYSFDELFDFVDNVDIKDIEFIQDGMEMNMRMAGVGLSDELNSSIGSSFLNIAENITAKAKAYTVAASEARMVGFPLPVMSSAGSGNHGLVAIIPATYIGNALELSQEKVIRAVTISHLVTIYVKVHIGVLSPVCGCGVAAGVGCSAALTYLYGGSREQMKSSISNMIAGLSGMICDGAKIGCAYKLAISVNAAADASYMALKDNSIPCDNGILGETAEESVKNLAELSKVGMSNTDQTILGIMLQKNK